MSSAPVPAPSLATPLHHLTWLLQGKPLDFTATSGPRTLQADVLEELARRCHGKVEVPVEIKGAVIQGRLDWRYSTFTSTVKLTECEFEQDVDLSYACFERTCDLSSNLFCGKLTGIGCQFGADWKLEGSCVAEFCDFYRAAAEGDAKLGGVHFHNGVGFGSVRCMGRFVCGAQDLKLNFRRSRFEGLASFMDADLRGLCNISGAVFGSTANFDRMRVGGPLFLRSARGVLHGTARTEFFGPVDATALRADALYAQGAIFHGTAVFARIRVEGISLFNRDEAGNRTWFGGLVDFTHSSFGAEANFSSAYFGGFVNFYNAEVNGPLNLRSQPAGEGGHLESGPQTEFRGGLRLQEARVRGGLYCNGAVFTGYGDFGRLRVEGRTDFQKDSGGRPVEFLSVFGPLPEATALIVTFHGARFGSGVSFTACRCELPVNFSAAQVPDWVSFMGARFADKVTLAGARVKTLYLSPVESDEKEDVRFEGPVNLRGLEYESIYLPLDHVLEKLGEPGTEGAGVEGARRQPFTQLETVLRNMGSEEAAGRVQLSYRAYERKRHWEQKDFKRYVGSWLYWVVANYGVVPLRLLYFSLAFLIAGTILFHQPGALELKETSDKTAGATEAPLQMSWWQAAGSSLNQFLPVEIPAGRKLAPSRNYIGPTWVTYEVYGTVHKLFGWLLVPLGVGALAGILNRRGKAPKGGGE